MFININKKVITLILGLTVSLTLMLSDALAISQDEAIDLAMGAIEGPIFNRTLFPHGQEGAPLFPPYKQQPPAAQQDFRPAPPSPAPTPTPTTIEPEPTPIPIEPGPTKPKPGKPSNY